MGHKGSLRRVSLRVNVPIAKDNPLNQAVRDFIKATKEGSLTHDIVTIDENDRPLAKPRDLILDIEVPLNGENPERDVEMLTAILQACGLPEHET